MEIDVLLAFLRGWAFILIALGLALGLAMFKGRQNLVNLMMGAYLGLLLYRLFPYTDRIADSFDDQGAEAGALLALYVVFTGLSTWLFARLMPREYLEGVFETFGKKILLAASATILVMSLCLHFLPVSDLVNMGTPLPAFLLSDNLTFVWLILPLGVLLFI